MRLQLLSDLHLERQTDLQTIAVPGADLLVLAGDVGSYQAGSRLVTDDFGLGRFSPRRDGAPWPRVLYVPGNHEYDGIEYDIAHGRLRATCEELGIEWLDRAQIVIGDVRFLGTTLWSDFDGLAAGEATPTKQLAAREKAFRAANFYLRRYSTLIDGQHMLAERQRDLALDCQAWLREALAQPFDGRTVVVTHYAPSLRSADPRYGLTPGTAGFCNSLDELLPFADFWLHGHLHCMNDYVVESATGPHGDVPHRCRVVSNPLGYAHKGEQADFRPDLIIEV
ncbi:metallophosphoesterase [Roseateles aquatilis]|uniref:Metallophosphoesterase n=1 Tax=Roseateles aquatilis TaxID=431061 RepID=A0A246J119_9BURK|nr:metallophosphoesterase [Roseateles aquatilis]OWQ86162.1 metallophosphoesterase [Roseateles aquatilis]